MYSLVQPVPGCTDRAPLVSSRGFNPLITLCRHTTRVQRIFFCPFATAQPADGPRAHPPLGTPNPTAVSTNKYQALVSELASQTPQQLREAAHQRPMQLLDSGFLFWLRDWERRPGLGASEREVLSRLGQELTLMREWTEEQANRTLLPSLASSLAYTNLRRWREETGEQAPQVVPGVDLEQLYRMGEEEERKLRESMERGLGGGGLGPRRGATRTGIEEFTKHNKAYADLAAGAMARVRARLMGFDDEGPSAAAAVLTVLLDQMGSPEERATFLPDAFAPPGLQILPNASATSAGSDAGGGGKPSFVVTTPDALTAAVRSRLASLTAPSAPPPPPPSSAAAATTASSAFSPDSLLGASAVRPDAALSSVPPLSFPLHASWSSPPSAGPPPPSCSSSSTSSHPGAGKPVKVTGAGQRGAVLPSGEDEEAALKGLLDMIEEYDRHVFSRKTPLERMGHIPGPW